MRRTRWVAVVALLLVLGVAAPAGAQYVTEPGNTPTAGTVDNGAPSIDTSDPEVGGVQFGRDANSLRRTSDDSSLLELAWLFVLMALSLGLFFLFFWRRRRDEEEEEDDAFPFPGPATA